jgi:cell division protein FtsN
MARRDGGRVSTLLVLLGIAGVLGGTFSAGFFAGRYWSRVSVMTGLVRPQAGDPAERDATGRDRQPGRATGRPTPGTDMPALTFYQELTAPLGSPPPRPPEPQRPADTAARMPAVPAASVSTTMPGAKSAAAPGTSAPRSFTVQVGAYGTRGQADALARRLATRGLPASVSEATTDRGVRYRVRVGSYPSREAARDAATRVGADWHLATFVAPR